jgi:hypothetical protein
MQSQEKPEQPKKQESGKLVDPVGNRPDEKNAPCKQDSISVEYFWTGTVYSLEKTKTVHVYGIVTATRGEHALAQLVEKYKNPMDYRAFNALSLNRV